MVQSCTQIERYENLKVGLDSNEVVTFAVMFNWFDIIAYIYESFLHAEDTGKLQEQTNCVGCIHLKTQYFQKVLKNF